MGKVWYYQVWIQNNLDFMVLILNCTCMLHFTICWDSFFRRMYLFLFWEYLCELFIRVSEGLLPDFSQRNFCIYRQFFEEINPKQSLKYLCIFPFLKVRLFQRYFKRGPNARNKVRLLKGDINAKQSPFRYLNTGNYNVFMHFTFFLRVVFVQKVFLKNDQMH